MALGNEYKRLAHRVQILTRLTMSSSTLKTDVFPRVASTSVQKLRYPDFTQLPYTVKVWMFLCHLDLKMQIYFKENDLDVKQLLHVGKSALTLGKSYEKSWFLAKQKLLNNPNRRLGFKFGNNYLVKGFFTFGQRSVAPGTVHVIQTLNVPILFFFVEPDKNVTIRNKLFDSKEQFLYSKRRLEQNQCYRVPPNTVYVLLTTQNCLFSLDIVGEEMQLPCLDPTKDEKPMFRCPMDCMPVPIPFIEERELHDSRKRSFPHSKRRSKAPRMSPLIADQDPIIVQPTDQTPNLSKQMRNLIDQMQNLIDQMQNLCDQLQNLIDQTPNLTDQMQNLIAQMQNLMGQTPNLIAQMQNLIDQMPNLIDQMPNLIDQMQNQPIDFPVLTAEDLKALPDVTCDFSDFDESFEIMESWYLDTPFE